MATEAPFLERAEPLARLEAALAAARERRGRVVSIEGEAGIGKTTLVLRFVGAHQRDTQVHVGGCEHLSTPEPLGPLRDIARESGGRFAVSGASPLATFEALLRHLTPAAGRPSLLLVEDIHWADDSTLDLLRYLGRRIRTSPVLVVVTLRNDEPGSQARLAALWDDIPRDARERVELKRLTPAAVQRLAAHVTHAQAGDLYAATGGNPFHVTEYLAAKPPEVPTSVRDATLARAERLSERARRVLDCASLFPRRIDERLLADLADDADHAGVEECLRGGMLNTNEGMLAFRHELARRAVHDGMSPLRRRSLHAAALARLERRGEVRAAQAAHHAAEAGDDAALLRHSLRAADEARDLGAYREAVEHQERALSLASLLEDAERARILERQADDAERCGLYALGTRALDAAIAQHRQAGDVLGLGNALRIAARLAWLAGDVVLADERQAEAREVLRDHMDTWQYAMALSGQSQLDMLAERNELARARATEAMQRAEALGRSDIYLHALTNLLGVSKGFDSDGARHDLLDAIAEARRRGVPDMLPRMYVNLTYAMMCERRYHDIDEQFAAGMAAATDREHMPLEGYMRGARALSLVDRGRLREALAEAELVVGGPYPRGLTRFNAIVAATRARQRLGLPDEGLIAELRDLPTSRRDIMRAAPLAVADAEAAWLGSGEGAVVAQLRAAFELSCRTEGQPWTTSDTAWWLRLLEVPFTVTGSAQNRLNAPVRFALDGDWQAAAEGWLRIGCPYEQAIALSLTGEGGQRAALAIFDELGAAPAAARLRREMRTQGVRDIPRGPNAATRANPLGLTARQQDVLDLLLEGLSNGAIAQRLGISPKTAEHHVSAILALLGARTRAEAITAARAREI
jgi:DNA-binding CsgD family transcriptional regulator